MRLSLLLCCTLGLMVVAAGLFEVAARKNPPEPPMSKDPAGARPAPDELRQRLTEQQFEVTQNSGTEPPFHNAYWDNHADGLYLDVVSGRPLFSSVDKYDSGTGWPSFSRSLDDEDIVLKTDSTLGATRTEVRAAGSDSHLGHVFDDGPGPAGQRFCMNSAALRFVPLEQLKDAGLGHYLFAFADRRHWDIATFAGGCFWGMEEFFSKHAGVLATQVGYTGGSLAQPHYEDITTGRTGHAEAIQVLFDPQKVSYEQLLLYFFRIHDPTTVDQQGNDRGSQYRSAIFCRNAEQQKVAAAIKARVDGSHQWKRPVVTKLEPLKRFWRAEPYHQDYLHKNPGGYSCHVERPLTF